MSTKPQQLSSLLGLMEQATTWEWSELLGWLAQLQTTLTAAEGLTAKELRLLAKRLHQCLQPAFPELVHLETLKVYGLAISHTPSQGPLRPLYLSSLYSFFTYAKEDSQEAVLFLFSHFLLSRHSLTSASLDSFLLAMLLGLDESQFAPQITTLLSDMRKEQQLEFESALWRAVLKVPSIRKTALELYLKICDMGHSEADKVAVNALVTALWSCTEGETLVPTIQVITRIFPVLTDRISILDQRKLTAGMIKQLNTNQEIVTKLIVKWFTAGLHDKDGMQNLVVPVLMDLFDWMQTEENSSTECLNRLECLLETRGLEEMRVCVMQGFAFHFFTFVHYLFEYTKFGERVKMKAGLVLNSLEDVAETIWDSLVEHFLEGFGVADSQVIPVFLFALESYPVPKGSRPRLLTAAQEIVYRMSSLENEDFHFTLRILKEISTVEVSLPASVLHHCDKIISRTLTSQALNAGVAMDCLCYLHVSNPEASFDESVAVLVSFVSSGDIAHQLLLSRLFTPTAAGLEDVISKRLGTSLSFSIFRQLWELGSDSAGKLLLNMASVRPKRFAAFLSEQLNKSDSSTQVHRFSHIWYLAVRYKELELETLFQSRPGLIKVLNLLNSPDYPTRQEAAYWLSASLSHADILINTLIDQLKTAETEGLALLSNVVHTAGEAVVMTLTSQPDFPLAKRLFTTLLDLIETAGTESAVSAAECLYFLLSHRNSSLALHCFSRVLSLLEICHLHNRPLVLMQLIEVLRVIMLRNDLEERPAGLRSKVGSQEFETAYLLPIGREEELLWDTWVRFQVDTMPLVFALIRPVPLIDLIKGLFRYYLPAIPHSLPALKVVIYCSLHLLDIRTFVHKYGELIMDSYTDLLTRQVKPDLFTKNAVKSIAQGRVMGKSGYLFCDLAITVFIETKSVIKSIASSIETEDNPMNISSKGCDPYDGVVRNRGKKQRDAVIVLRSLAKTYPQVFFCQCVTLWLENYQNESAEADNFYVQLLELVHFLEFQPETALNCAKYYLEMGLDLRKSKKSDDEIKKLKSQEGALCHFLYCFMCGVAEIAFEGKETQKLCWTSLIDFLSLLAEVDTTESSLWQLHFIHLLGTRMPMESAPKRNLQAVKKHYLRLFEELMLVVCSSDPTELGYPHSPATYLKRMDQVSLIYASFFTLTFTLKKCAELFVLSRSVLLTAYAKEAKQLLHTFLPLHNLSSGLVAQLCLALVQEAGQDLELTPMLQDFLRGEQLWEQLKLADPVEIISKWTYLVQIITNFTYAESSVPLVEEVLNLSLGYLTSKVTEIRSRANSLKLLSFLIYTAEEMTFESSLNLIVENLIEYLRLHEGAYTPHCFLLLRVLMLKVDENAINDFWTRLWPHILTELMQILTNEDIAVLHKWEAVKLLDFLYCIQNEDFHRHLWIFTYNGAELALAARYQHVPVIPREFNLLDDTNFVKSRLFTDYLRSFSRNDLDKSTLPPETDRELASGAKDFFLQVLRGLTQLNEIDYHALRHAIVQDFKLL